MPSVRESVHPFILRSSHFYINLNISFIYKDIFTKFAGDVYGYNNMSMQNFGLILKNKNFDPFFSVKWGHLTTKALYIP